MRFEVRIYSPSQGVNALQWDAACEADVRARAVREGLEIIELRKGRETRTFVFGRGNFPTRQFAQEIVALTEAGFGLVEALETLQAKEQNASYRDVVQGVLAQLRSGASFSQQDSRSRSEENNMCRETETPPTAALVQEMFRG